MSLIRYDFYTEDVYYNLENTDPARSLQVVIDGQHACVESGVPRASQWHFLQHIFADDCILYCI